MNASVPYGPADTFMLVVKNVPNTKADGTFTTSVTNIGTTQGMWTLNQNGTRLEMIGNDDEGTYSVRRIDQVDKTRLTMSASDAEIVAIYTENGIGEVSPGVTVVGGNAYDELVRVK